MSEPDDVKSPLMQGLGLPGPSINKTPEDDDKPRVSLPRLAGSFSWAVASNALTQSEARRLLPGNASVVVGVVSAVGSLATLLGVVTNTLGDGRAASRWGGRRPFILLAAVAIAASCACWVVGDRASSFALVAASYVCIWAAVGVGSSALQALIPDTLPSSQHGTAGSVIGLLQVLGLGVCFGMVSAGVPVWTTITVMGAVNAVSAVPTLLCSNERCSPRSAKEGGAGLGLGASEALKGFLFSPREHIDWVLYLLQHVALSTATGYAAYVQFWLADTLELANPERLSGMVGVVVIAVAVAVGLPVGFLSDRYGRKAFLVASTLIMTASLVVWAFAESEALMWAALCTWGVGNGMYGPVDVAVSCATLPSSANAGKHMAIANVVSTVSGLVTQVLYGLLLKAFSAAPAPSASSSAGGFERMYGRMGYRTLFLVSAACCFASFVLSCSISLPRAKRAQQSRDAREALQLQRNASPQASSSPLLSPVV
eukprot:m51a1_g7682 hypothetical protein (485) ;mRNA; r:11285-12818